MPRLVFESLRFANDPNGPFIGPHAFLDVITPIYRGKLRLTKIKAPAHGTGGTPETCPASSEPVTYSIVKGFQTIAELIQCPAVLMTEARPGAGALSPRSQPMAGSTESGSFQHRASGGHTESGQASGSLRSLAPAPRPTGQQMPRPLVPLMRMLHQDTLPLTVPLVPSEPSV